MGDINILGLLKLTILFIIMIIAAVIVLYNWLYLTKMYVAVREIDMHPPRRISFLIKASIAMGSLTLLFTILVVFLRVY
jgi:hypothetical protein